MKDERRSDDDCLKNDRKERSWKQEHVSKVSKVSETELREFERFAKGTTVCRKFSVPVSRRGPLANNPLGLRSELARTDCSRAAGVRGKV